jgi:hypothetical protein
MAAGMREPEERGPPWWRWIALAPAAAAVLVGLLCMTAPRPGSALFGIPATEGTALAYVTAIGVRDLAFGLYIVGLTLFANRRAVGVALAVTVVIPAGDLVVLLAARGLVWQLLLHAGSGLYMAGAALWVLKGPGARTATRGTP